MRSVYPLSCLPWLCKKNKNKKSARARGVAGIYVIALLLRKGQPPRCRKVVGRRERERERDAILWADEWSAPRHTYGSSSVYLAPTSVTPLPLYWSVSVYLAATSVTYVLPYWHPPSVTSMPLHWSVSMYLAPTSVSSTPPCWSICILHSLLVTPIPPPRTLCPCTSRWASTVQSRQSGIRHVSHQKLIRAAWAWHVSRADEEVPASCRLREDMLSRMVQSWVLSGRLSGAFTSVTQEQVGHWTCKGGGRGDKGGRGEERTGR